MTPLAAPMLEPVLGLVPKYRAHHASRPMMARDADSVYWMSRYVERAEHVARLLLVNSNLLVDVGDLAPQLQQLQWRSIAAIMRTEPPAAVTARLSGQNAPSLRSRLAHVMA